MSYINRNNTHKSPSSYNSHHATGDRDNAKDVVSQRINRIHHSPIELSRKSHNIKKQSSSLGNSILKNIKNICNRSNKPNSNLRELVQQSKVVVDSHLAATASFRNDAKFNHIVSEATPEQRLVLANDKNTIMNGNIEPLVGKGIIATGQSTENLPISINQVRFDSQAREVIQNSGKTSSGITYFTGSDIESSELIPGLPLGNYFNQQRFDNILKVLTISNGDRGTVGCQFDLTQIEEGAPLLMNTSQLSGCTVVYAIKDNTFFSYHTGKNGNDTSGWKTSSDGVSSIIDAHSALTTSQHSHSDSMPDNQTLVDFLANNFDFYALTYCGHGEKVESNPNVFDYNQNRTLDDDKVRVGNAMALITRENGHIKVQTLSDDMTVNKSDLTTQSLAHRIGEYTLESIGEVTHL
ncbi:cytotoxic necrotizing factor Rho-activating domain-containing protein [Yersinia proxima]|uniref:Cytotoxic necrotizing factor Rho-activating domain-containing protein n=1 Tax=Yersinia proxima TaxID=2890316 RepID=A0ABW9EUD2_9GAMM|nr:cytotoxic necrotizing factor Rho-activating domain-containing protein [Yersinia proxima]CNL83525.1 cytotoxic necrotizing factor [Yersinia intermedia]